MATVNIEIRNSSLSIMVRKSDCNDNYTCAGQRYVELALEYLREQLSVLLDMHFEMTLKFPAGAAPGDLLNYEGYTENGVHCVRFYRAGDEEAVVAEVTFTEGRGDWELPIPVQPKLRGGSSVQPRHVMTAFEPDWVLKLLDEARIAAAASDGQRSLNRILQLVTKVEAVQFHLPRLGEIVQCIAEIPERDPTQKVTFVQVDLIEKNTGRPFISARVKVIRCIMKESGPEPVSLPDALRV
jgi:hypothetical protein